MGTDTTPADPMEGHNNPPIVNIGGPHPYPNSADEERKDGLRKASPFRNMLTDSL
jgi:hypothetical protein